MTDWVFDLGGPLVRDRPLHAAIEELARTTGIVIERETVVSDRVLAWVDAAWSPGASCDAPSAGVWIARSGDTILGCALFDPRFPRDVPAKAVEVEGRGILVGVGIDAAIRGRGVGAILVQAALFALHERGYRQALWPLVCGTLDGFARRLGARPLAGSAAEAVPGRRMRTTILASGQGRTFAHVAEAARLGRLPLEITRVLVNRPGAGVFARANDAGIEAEPVLWNRTDESRSAFDRRVLAATEATEPELVLLLGWMHVLPPEFVARFHDVLNLHPAFLPLDPSANRVAFPDGSWDVVYRGAHAVDDALAAGSRWLGATVHRITAAVDRGVVLARAPFFVREPSDRASIGAELHSLECRVVDAAVVRWFRDRSQNR